MVRYRRVHADRFLMLVLVAAVLSACTLQPNVASVPPGGRLGGKAADLRGTTLDGTALAVDFRAKKTVLVFWASWCGPCRHEQPGLTHMATDLAQKGVRFIGVDFLDHDQAAARAFVAEFKVPYPSLYDDAGALAARFEVDAPPGKVLVDGHGVIVGRVPGEISEDKLERLIQATLLSS